jgi:hypothetical protein
MSNRWQTAAGDLEPTIEHMFGPGTKGRICTQAELLGDPSHPNHGASKARVGATKDSLLLLMMVLTEGDKATRHLPSKDAPAVSEAASAAPTAAATAASASYW